MLICVKCGVENELGRVFCNKCGAKLDFTNMSSEDIFEEPQIGLFRRHWLKLVIAVIVIALLIGALGFWANTQALGERGTRYGRRRVEQQLGKIIAARPGRPVPVSFTEGDINGYFEHSKIEKMGIDSFSVSLMEGYFLVRVVRRLGPIEIGSLELGPPISYDLACFPIGTIIRVKKVSVGHLRLWGPAKVSAVRKIYNMVANEKEWALFKNISDFKVARGKITIMVKK